MTSSVVETKVNRNSPDFDKNTRRMVDLLTEIKNQETAIQQGGGAKAIEAQHKKGRLTARERIAKLIDPHTSFSSWEFTPRTKCTKSGAARRPRARLPASGESAGAW